MIVNKSMYKTIQDNIKNAIKNNYNSTNIYNIIYPSEIKLISVTKKANIEAIKSLYDLGQRDFGENYLDELVDKSKNLPNDINWHFIGHLQSKKVKRLLSINNLKSIQTVDSLKIANEINKHCELQSRKLDIYIQINISNEQSKSGIEPNNEQILNMYNQIKELKNIEIKGIMALGKISCKEEFLNLYKIKDFLCKSLNINHNQLDISNGTSSDYELAISFGSNVVRIGSILFEDNKI